ncbi:MAG: tRNA 4-thiouridine(8) synthase ThiI [Verrucomicrobiaceae bacterium]|nr:tRNA 4-thiouridine(8) synthase ThiI [Verrucomicrobiaceae bacterium]
MGQVKNLHQGCLRCYGAAGSILVPDETDVQGLHQKRYGYNRALTRRAFMKFIIKFFPEITIKSRVVRKQMVKQLRDNLRVLLKPIDPNIVLDREWDKLTVETQLPEADVGAAIIEVLSNTSGIAYFLDVQEYPLIDLADVYDKTAALWLERLRGKTFSVRCKRSGQHSFTSLDVERDVGGLLGENSGARGVDLRNPEVQVRIEIRDQNLYIVNERFPGIGGFPLGTQESVVSLLSGGFDSTVASYLTLRRGMRTHFCFFNLGGREHELGVKEVAHFIWSKYGASSRVKFVAVPFENVVAEILKNVDDSQMGVVLKRMMLRAATHVAQELEAQALVTGESVAQVSSQTLTNLTVIDRATDMLVLRPLITMAKGEIIRMAAEIGTEDFAARMPEYCGVISVKPTTRAKLFKIEHEETKFDMSVLTTAIAQARYMNIDEIANEDVQHADVEILSAPLFDAVILDVRAPLQAERTPLRAGNIRIEKIPFYELQTKFAQLDKEKTYLLYCDKGVMSKLHAAHLVEQGFRNVKVYRPAP